MKVSSILIAVIVLAFPFYSSAQQKERALTPEEILAVQQGELAEFDNLAYRFEVAFGENELESMEDIRTEMLKMMEKEVAQLEIRYAAAEPVKSRLERLDQQKKHIAFFSNYKIADRQTDLNQNERPELLDRIDQFREQMQLELLDLQAELAANRHD